MSSSTSSSRPVFLRIFLACVLGMGASMGLVRLFTFAMDANAETILGRVLEAMDALPQIVAEEDELVMVYGSSMVDAGFSARQFDRQLAQRGVEVKSFNFGFGGLNPFFQDYLARRIRGAFEAEDRRLGLTIIELNPFQITEARWRGAQPVIDSYLAVLASPREVWEMTREDPARGIRILNIHFLRDDISAEVITWFFGRGLRPPRPRSDLPRDEAKEERLQEVKELLDGRFEEDYPDFPEGTRWWYPWQGAGTLPEERSEETVALITESHALRRQARRMDNDKLNRIACCDIEGLHFEDELVEAFIRTVQSFQEISDQVEIVLLPRNTDWIHYSEDARGRLDAMIQRVSDGTGLPVRDFQDLDVITPEMFRDTTHLSRYEGDIAFTEFLVDTYEETLRAEPRGQGSAAQ
ncbi:MAG: hypothetical protein AAGN66_13565 [Acidobacteriota bacterium]